MDDDLMSLFGDEQDDNEEDDDIFGAFDSGDPFGDLDDSSVEPDDPFAESEDPFASLDAASEDEDDIFADFSAPEMEEAPPLEEEAAPEDDLFGDDEAPLFEEEEVEADRPAWVSELGGFDDESLTGYAGEPFTPSTPRERPNLLQMLTGTGPQGMALGMTAQQRMVLAVFLFLDVAVLGFLILMAIGAISF